MKKVVNTTVVLLLVMLSLVSCRRVYRCSCSFKNKTVYAKDLGMQHKKDAEAICSGYDTTVVGEKWKCTLY